MRVCPAASSPLIVTVASPTGSPSFWNVSRTVTWADAPSGAGREGDQFGGRVVAMGRGRSDQDGTGENHHQSSDERDQDGGEAAAAMAAPGPVHWIDTSKLVEAGVPSTTTVRSKVHTPLVNCTPCAEE